jgi:hypothetical protein
MNHTRIPKRIYYRKWPKRKEKFSIYHLTKSILRKWKIDLDYKDIIQHIAANSGKDENEVTPQEIKNTWKTLLEKHMEKYIQKRVRKDRSQENSFYKRFIPATKKPKPYLALNTKSTHMKLAATTARIRPEKCPLCKMEDIILARHILTQCGGTYPSRKALLDKLHIPTKKFNKKQQNRFFGKIYEAGPGNNDILEYTEIAAASYDLALSRKQITKKYIEKLTGRIIDIRQHGEWYRTKIIHHDQFKNNEVIVDSTNLDDWPEFWAGSSFTLNLDELIQLEAVKLRDPNALSFSNIEQNSGKIFYLNKTPIKLIKHLQYGTYQSNRGKVNLRDLITNGQLNSCDFNGNVARRYNSANQGASPMPIGKD